MGSEAILFTGQDYASWSGDFDFYLKSKNLDQGSRTVSNASERERLSISVV